MGVQGLPVSQAFPWLRLYYIDLPWHNTFQRRTSIHRFSSLLCSQSLIDFSVDKTCTHLALLAPSWQLPVGLHFFFFKSELATYFFKQSVTPFHPSGKSLSLKLSPGCDQGRPGIPESVLMEAGLTWSMLSLGGCFPPSCMVFGMHPLSCRLPSCPVLLGSSE